MKMPAGLGPAGILRGGYRGAHNERRFWGEGKSAFSDQGASSVEVVTVRLSVIEPTVANTVTSA